MKAKLLQFNGKQNYIKSYWLKMLQARPKLDQSSHQSTDGAPLVAVEESSLQIQATNLARKI